MIKDIEEEVTEGDGGVVDPDQSLLWSFFLSILVAVARFLC